MMIQARESYQTEVKTVIVVDDDENNREMLELAIASETHYQAFGFPDSQVFFQHLDEITALKPSLFLLDYLLPPDTAFDLYDQLQLLEVFKEVPTIILTASPAQDVEDDIALRHLTLLTKPFELDQLFTMLKQIVG